MMGTGNATVKMTIGATTHHVSLTLVIGGDILNQGPGAYQHV